jgi:hypothetical protein
MYVAWTVNVAVFSVITCLRSCFGYAVSWESASTCRSTRRRKGAPSEAMLMTGVRNLPPVRIPTAPH